MTVTVDDVLDDNPHESVATQVIVVVPHGNGAVMTSPSDRENVKVTTSQLSLAVGGTIT